MSEKDPDLKYPEEARSGNPTLTELDAMGGEPIADRPDINPLEEEIARLRAEIEGHLAKSETRERAIADLLIQKKTLEDRVGKMNVPLPSKKLIHHEDYLEGRHFRIGLVSDTHIGSTMA
ncbi:MAG: hypothetical protein M1609_14690, partial [Firmicutes bacterium]|nr:hypothetical protein [Bacillota bacterium]